MHTLLKPWLPIGPWDEFPMIQPRRQSLGAQLLRNDLDHRLVGNAVRQENVE
jgi:hypothetical protein